MVALMDSRNKINIHVSTRKADTYLSSRTTEPHRCYFGGSNQCICGKHRDPMGVSGIMADIAPTGTPREHLSVEL